MTTSKRVLIILSEWGYWGEELLGNLDALDGAGYQVDFATATGKRPAVIPVSMDPGFIDPPMGRTVTSPEVADKVRKLEESDRLDRPIDLSQLLPERPYRSAPDNLRQEEEYFRLLEAAAGQLTATYDGVVIVGGSGPMVDLANNQRVHDLVLAFYRADKPIAANGYGVACLPFARDREDRTSIIRGKHVTGHCIEFDYKAGTGFMGTDFVIGPPPYPLEYILRDAVAPGGQYHGNVGRLSVIVDYPFITGRTKIDSYLMGEKLVEVLDKGLRQWGFVAK
jgi:putative intracellular protease/amidase